MRGSGTRRHQLVWVTLTALAAIVLAACGSSSSGTTTTAAAASTTAATAGGSAVGSSTTAAGGTADWQKVIDSAKKEGGVTIYSSQGLDNLNDMAKRFQDKYGIAVTVNRGIDGDLNTKIEAEKTTGKPVADYWVSASESTIKTKATQGGWFRPAVGPAFNAPDYQRSTNYQTGDYFVVGAAILTFGWNTQLYGKGVSDYPDLLDPALAGGKIGIIEPTAPSIVDFWLYLEDNFGTDFVTKLAAQSPRIYPSSLPMGQALGSGEISVGSFVQPQTDAKKNGAPTDSGASPKGLWGARFFGMVLAQAPHPNAAQLLADFMVTQPGQESSMHLGATVLPNIAGSIGTTDKVRKQDVSRLTPDAVKAYQDKWNGLFKA